MNHPNREQWVPFLFGEAEPKTRDELRRHLKVCPECRNQLETWQRSLGRLDSWRLPAVRHQEARLAPLLQWSLVGSVAILLCVAFMLGRLSLGTTATADLSSAITAQVRTELRTELAALLQEQSAQTATALAASAEQTKHLLAEYDRTVRARMEAESAQRISGLLTLKKDVDTIAVNADAGLRDTEQRLAQLAVYRPPGPRINESTQH